MNTTSDELELGNIHITQVQSSMVHGSRLMVS